MSKKSFFMSLDKKGEKYLRKGQFLGAGHNGIVYMLPKRRVIKFFNDDEVCRSECKTLKKTSKSKYFPEVYDYGKNYIVREFVGGVRLDEYLKKNGINRDISHNLVKLIREFKRLRFKKLDIRCKDIYIAEDYSLTVIDPKKQYSKKVIYPRHLMKGLNKVGVLDDFLQYVKEIDEVSYNLWNHRIRVYLEKNIK